MKFQDVQQLQALILTQVGLLLPILLKKNTQMGKTRKGGERGGW